MTELPPRRRRPSLYRTVLSIAVAALVAAWLPFSVIYVDALNKRAAAPATVVASKSGRAVVITRTSGGQTVQTSAPATTGTPTPAQVPVTTRAS
jgi:hypothetical protein